MPTRLSPRDVLRFRMQAHGLAGGGLNSVDAVVRRLLAVQAQDFAQAGWALGVRCASATVADVAGALASGTIVRSWPMRGTLHFVPAEDLGWMLMLTAQRMFAKTVTRRRQLELDDSTIEKARTVIIDALHGGRRLERAQVMHVFEGAGIRTHGQRGYYLLYHLAQSGTVVWGPPAATQQALVLLNEWVSSPRHLERDQALAAFLTRYLNGHGPATLKDFAWWSGLTIADAKAARALAGTAVEDVTCEGTDYLIAPELADSDRAVQTNPEINVVCALPGFDEYILGYTDRSPVLDPAFAQQVTPGGNGIFQPTILSHGRAAGTWRRSIKHGKIDINPVPFTSLNSRETAGFARSARRFRRYLHAEPHD